MRLARTTLLVVSILFVSVLSVWPQDNIDEQIKAKQDAIQALEQKLAPKVAPLLVPNADLRLWISKSMTSVLTSYFNSLPATQRHVHYDATSEGGQLQNSNGGALGCGWYVSLEGGNSAHADLDLLNLVAGMNPNGSLDTSLGFHFSFTAQLHGHVKGPPGPCSLWHPWPTCDCPIGGGAGTSVGIDGQQGGTITGSLNPRSDANNWLIYDVSLTGPSSIPITISAGLQGIGNVGIPMNVNLPTGIISTGNVPNLFGGTGSITVPNVISKQYTFTIQPKPIAFDDTGYSATASAKIAWQ